MANFEVNITDDDYTVDVSTSPAITVDVADEAIEVDVISGAQGVSGPDGADGADGADAPENGLFTWWFRAGYGDDLGPWETLNAWERPSDGPNALPPRVQLEANATDETSSLHTVDLVAGIGWAGGSGGFRLICTFIPNPVSDWVAPSAGNGTRMFIGLTSETTTNTVNADDPGGYRIGLSFVNVAGGRGDTTFKFSTKNNVTESLVDSGVAPLNNNLYRLTMNAVSGGPVTWRLENLTAGTSATGTLSSNLPSSGVVMFARATLRAVGDYDKFLDVPGFTISSPTPTLGHGSGPGSGPTGPAGPTGPGVPTGGTSGQILKRNTATDYDASWSTLTASDVSAAPTARTITAGTGLTGGGDLSANRTFSADFGTGAGKVTEGNDARLTDARTPTAHNHSATEVTSGTLDIARVPTGTSGTTVALGNHDHTGVYDPAGTAASAVSTHESDTTSVHGIANTADLVLTSDARLSDARTPTAHTHGTADINSGTLDIARIPTGSSASTVCIGNDSRLSDARTPTAHNHAGSDINSGTVAFARLPTGSPLMSYGLITTTATSDGTNWSSITGSPVSITNGQSYRIRWMLRSYSAANTTGLQVRRVFAASGAATIHGMHYIGMSSATAGILQSSREGTNDHFLGLGNATSTTSASGSWVVEAVVTCTASGTLGLEMRTEVNTSSVTVDGDGSYWIAETWVQ
jgi:hypothetical protein